MLPRIFYFWKIYLYFSIGNGQPMEPALCQLYRHTFVPYKTTWGQAFPITGFAVLRTEVREWESPTSTAAPPVDCGDNHIGVGRSAMAHTATGRTFRWLTSEGEVVGPWAGSTSWSPPIYRPTGRLMSIICIALGDTQSSVCCRTDDNEYWSLP